MSRIVARLQEALDGSVLAEALPNAAEPLAEREADLASLDGPILLGLARTVAAWPETASFLSHRTQLIAHLAGADTETLAEMEAALDDFRVDGEGADLEAALDALRLLRREQTCLAACLQHAGLASFGAVSHFLSCLAETIAARALDLARRSLPVLDFAVIGMGKVAGREFTYHSDLDLIFLYEGGPDRVDQASRVGQRLVSYLTTMTGAGVAYAVDTRLRPSGRQGMLVTSLTGFERYQCEQALTWEHVAILRARPIAGDVGDAAEALARVHAHVRGESPWAALAQIREQAERERAASGDEIALKTGAGGTMDVDFLAGGALLERPDPPLPPLPSVPGLLRSGADDGPGLDGVLAAYDLIRRVEASARWLSGRPVETLPTGAEPLDRTAELVQPGLRSDALLAQLEAARERIRAAYRAVVDTGSISAL